MSDVRVCDLSDAAPGGAAWSNVSRLGPSQVAIDPQLGRLAFGTGQASPPLVSFVITAPSDIGGSELSDTPASPSGQPVVSVLRAGTGGALTSVAAGLAAAGGAGIVEVGDSRTYPGDLSVAIPGGSQLRLTSSQGALPVIALDTSLAVSIGEGGVLTLNGLIIAGGTLVVRGRPDRVELTDCTFVPGQRIGTDAGVAAPAGPSIVLALDPDWQTEVIVTNCITGPLLIPADGSTLSVTDSIVNSVNDGHGRSVALLAPARVVPVLRSPQPPAPLTLAPGDTRLQLALGTDPIRTVTLAAAPADVPAAASALDAALASTGARSFALDDRVVIVGDGRPLAVVATPGSGLAEGLGLTGPNARTRAVVGSAADLIAAASGGSLTITDHRGVNHPAVLAAGASTLAELASAVQSAVRAADPGLTGTMVGALDSALVLVPSGTDAVTVTGAAPDLSTAWSLGLVSPRPAIAGDFSGAPGAAVSLARCTIFGAVRAESVGVVRDSIITGLVITDRRPGRLRRVFLDRAGQPNSAPASVPTGHAVHPAAGIRLSPIRHPGLWAAAAHRSDRGDPRGERRLRDGRDGTARADAARRQLAPRHRGIPPLRPGGGCRRWHLKTGERPISLTGCGGQPPDRATERSHES